MLSESPTNKMVDPSADDAGNVTLKAVSGIKNEYHFPGVPHWHPLAIIASTYEEALALWKQLRAPATPAAEVPAEVTAAPAEAKVEAVKEPTNDKQ